MRTNNVLLILALFFAVIFINGCADKERTFVSDLQNSVRVDTLPLHKNDIAFFGTVVFKDTLFCIYRKKNVDTLTIAPILENGKFGTVKGFKLKDTTLFANRKDSFGFKISLYRSFMVNKDTILFFDRGDNSSASRCLWYYVISKDLSVVVDKCDAPDWYNMEIELTDEMKLKPDYGTFMDWNPEKQCLISYFHNYYSETDTSKLLMEIHPFESLRKNILPYKFPSCYKYEEWCTYAFHDLFFPIFSQNKYIMAFAVTSEIYEVENGALKVHNVKHKNFSNPKKYCVSDTIRGTIGDDFIRVAETSFAYVYFLYDKYNDKYYRFYEAEMSDKNKDGMKNIYPKDKTLAVNVISSDFSKSKESIITDEAGRFFTFSERSHYVLPYGIVNLVFDYYTGKLLQTTLKIDLSNYEK